MTETPGSGRTTARGLSPRPGSTPPQLAAKCRDHCIRRHAGTRSGAGNPKVAGPGDPVSSAVHRGTFRFGIGARAGMWSLRRGGRPFAGYPE